MDRDFFLNTGLHFEPSSQMPAWKLPEVNCQPGQHPADRFHHPNWEKSTDQYSQFGSALSSMVSSPASNSAVSNDAFAIRELIGKLGSICNAGGEVSQAALTAVVGGTDPYNNTNTSCYSTPLNSPPPKFNMPIMDHFVKESLPSMRNSMPLNPGLPSLVADPGFAERAAKFSCFGSRSFNDRTCQFGLNTNNPDFQFRSSVSPLIGNAKLPRASSSPSLKIDGSPMAIQDKNSAETHMEIRSGGDKKCSRLSGSAANSNEESSVSEQIPSGEIGLKIQNDSNSRKRKATPRGKAKEIASAATKEGEVKDDSSTKRLKQLEQENGGGKTEEDPKNNNGPVEEGQNQAKNNTKPPEPPKDYIHVRARRGQATDSHSLAERVRREKISERMKLLQDLVPGCNKVTGKALMLDEIINYVQSLQRQVEFLSMKLATVNPRLDFDMNSLLSKEMNQSNGNLPQHMYPMESSASAFYQQNPQQLLFNGSGSAPMTQSSVDTLPPPPPPPPPPVHGFTEAFPHFPGFGEDDLHSIVQMGFPESLNQETTFQPSQNFQSPNQTSEMKIEL